MASQAIASRRWARAIVGVCAAVSAALAATVDADVAKGQTLAHDVSKGNCLACHRIPNDPGAVSSANIEPPLVAIRQRFPDHALLRDQIWDPPLRNPKKRSCLRSESMAS